MQCCVTISGGTQRFVQRIENSLKLICDGDGVDTQHY